MESTTSQRQWVLAALERYEVPLVRYSFRLLGQKDSAREAVQHAFLQLCQRLPEELKGREAQWLFTVCRNKALDLIRGRQKLTAAAEGELADIAGREPDPAAVAEQQDLAGRLNRLVAQLPDDQREAIVLWSEGFSYRQIAQMAGHSEGNVRILVHRALKQLRQHCEVLQ